MFMPGFDFYEAKKSIKISKKHLTSYVNAPLVLELVSKELNHLAAILHVYAGGLHFMKKKKLLLFLKKKMEILLHF